MKTAWKKVEEVWLVFKTMEGLVKDKIFIIVVFIVKMVTWTKVYIQDTRF